MPTSTIENQNASDSRTDKAVGSDALLGDWTPVTVKMPENGQRVLAKYEGAMVGGGLSPAEVESFDGWLSLQITAAHRAEKISAETGDYAHALKMQHTAANLAAVQYQLRRRVGDANERQPTSNKTDDQRAAARG